MAHITPTSAADTRTLLLDRVTSGTAAIDVNGHGAHHSWYVQTNGSITGGSVAIETAISTDFAGTWAGITTASALQSDSVTWTYYSGAALLALRARVVDPITGGGTVTVGYISTS